MYAYPRQKSIRHFKDQIRRRKYRRALVIGLACQSMQKVAI
jgi:hypothetical protein